MARIGTSDLDVFPLCLGGNVFGWTADEQQSFTVLDAFTAAGGNFIDTADVYSAWGEGNSGGESETIIGRWLARRGRRDDVVIATKVGQLPSAKGLSAASIRKGAEDSLRRLGTDHIDLYYAHIDDTSVPLEETLGAFDALVREGKVRHLAASNYSTDRLAEALEISKRENLATYVALQPEYSLVERGGYEGKLAALVAIEGLSAVPYWGLAKGFLTGKYRPGVQVESARAQAAGAYLDERGLRVLAALDEVSAAHADAPLASVALAWLAAQPTVAAPIASARTVEQLAEILPAATLELTEDELGLLTKASAN
ncbi:aryl-alcohol dehydrogenase-like predicted oxidoreductase [Crossiella equi]|uniref:Aryl-alcohol dehydrogenase-like predicted oxidoreductase n=1 Tax=Crossiella equi TaxID=130796 RepID=A0ABS5AGJ4_9PSEU|nr:aldo/keto reductase [Crossiella equi]MBP2475685.1 aryl-alcohol dehydrogenase-like predicted oxidoreductase [Crossiella equi]